MCKINLLKTLKHFLDSKKVPLADYLDNKGWVYADRNELLLKKAINRVQVDALLSV